MHVLRGLCSPDGSPVGSPCSLEAASHAYSSLLASPSAIWPSTADPASPCAVPAAEPGYVAPLALFAEPQDFSTNEPAEELLHVLCTNYDLVDRAHDPLRDAHGSVGTQSSPPMTAQVDSSPQTTSPLSPNGQILKGKGAGSLAHLLSPNTTLFPNLRVEPYVHPPRAQGYTVTLDPAWFVPPSTSPPSTSPSSTSPPSTSPPSTIPPSTSVISRQSVSLPLSNTSNAPACAPVSRAATLPGLANLASFSYLLGLSRTDATSYESEHSGHWPAESPDYEALFTLNPSTVCLNTERNSSSFLDPHKGAKQLETSNTSESPAFLSPGPASLTDTVGADTGTEAGGRDLINTDGLITFIPYSGKRYRNRKLLSGVKAYMYAYLGVHDFRQLEQLEPRGQWVQRLQGEADGRADGAEAKDVYHLDFSPGRGKFYEANHEFVRALASIGMNLVDAEPESYGILRGVLQRSHMEHIVKDLLDSARSGFRIGQNKRHRSASEKGKDGGGSGHPPSRGRRQSSVTTASTGGRRLIGGCRAARRNT